MKFPQNPVIFVAASLNKKFQHIGVYPIQSSTAKNEIFLSYDEFHALQIIRLGECGAAYRGEFHQSTTFQVKQFKPDKF